MATLNKLKDGTFVTFSDGEEVEFKYPDASVVGMGLSQLAKNPFGFGLLDAIISNCYKDGTIDKDSLKESVAYLLELEAIVDDLCGKMKCDVTVTSGSTLFRFTDGTYLTLKKITRQVYIESRTKSMQNPLNGLKHIVRNLTETADGNLSADDVCNSLPRLLGISEVLEQYISQKTEERLGN